MLLKSVIVSSIKGLSEVTFTPTSTPLAPSAHTTLLSIAALPTQSETKVSVGLVPQLVVILAASRLEGICLCPPINAIHTSTLFTG